MSEHELSILLRLRDEATKQIQQFAQKVTNEMDKAGDAMVSMGKQLNQVSGKMAFLGAAITGPLALAFKTASNYSIEVNDSLTRLGDSTIALQNTIATAMVPVVDKLNGSMWRAVRAFQNLDPKMRDTIVQGALVSGIFLLVGSGALKAISAIEILIGKLLIFTATGISINPVGIAIVAIGAAIALVIANIDKIQSAAVKLYDFFDKVKDKIINFLPKITESAENTTSNFLQSMGLPTLPMFDIVFDKIKELGKSIDELQSKKMIGTGIQSGINAFLGGFLPGLGNAVNAAKSLMPQAPVNLGTIEIQSPFSEFDMALKKFELNFKQTFTQAYEAAVNIGKNSAQILISQVSMFSSKFGEGFAAMVMHGKNFGESMKKMFFDMAEAFIAAVAQMIAQWLAFMALKAAASFFLFHEGGAVMHQGGLVPPKFHHGGPVYAHSGLSVDEVPIIAQRGEGILSRRGMRALGGPSALNELNSGKMTRAEPLALNMSNSDPRSSQDINLNIKVNFNNAIIASTIDIDHLEVLFEQVIDRGSDVLLAELKGKKLLCVEG